MPIVLSIENEGLPVAAVLSGATELTANGTVILGSRVMLAGATELVANGSLLIEASANLAGGTELIATGRLNSEANVFGAANLAGATALTADSEGRLWGGPVVLAGATELVATGSVDKGVEFGFTFFVDVMDAALTNAVNNNNRSYAARLTADGVPVAIIRATLDAPDDTLGTELSVTLARPDANLVSLAASLTFELEIWTGTGFEPVPLLTGGKVSSRSVRYANEEGLPADSVSITIVDVMADRWNLAPEAQTILYDPQTVDPPQLNSQTDLRIYTSEGEPIEPVVEAVPNMRLSDVLEAAYVSGCGFDHVVTNIDDFPVEQVSFTMTGGYDAAVRPLLAAFDPLPFVVGNDLWLISFDNPLPAGFNAREFPAGNAIGIDDDLPGVETVDAILVKLRDDGSGEYFTERLETNTVRNADGLTSTDTERRVREYRNFDNPTQIIREEEASLRVRVLDSAFTVLSEESRTATFDALNRPTGYRRTLSMRLPDLTSDGHLATQNVVEEMQYITYTPHPLLPSKDTQDRVETVTRGLILIDHDNEYLGEPYRLPFLDAHKSGYIDIDADQETEFGMIKTEIITLKVSGAQVQRERSLVNHVASVADAPSVQTLPGSADIDRRAFHTRTVLLRLPATSGGRFGSPSTGGRRVQEFDGTSLPSSVAMRLAQQRLARLNSPPRNVGVQMPFVDPSIRRGSDIKLRGRGGALVGTFIVRGYSVTVERANTGSVEATMTLRARELKQ